MQVQLTVVIQNDLEAGCNTSVSLKSKNVAFLVLQVSGQLSRCCLEGQIKCHQDLTSTGENTDNDDIHWEVFSPPVPGVSASEGAELPRDSCVGAPQKMPSLRASKSVSLSTVSSSVQSLVRTGNTEVPLWGSWC